jgi:hypothetical protein
MASSILDAARQALAWASGPVLSGVLTLTMSVALLSGALWLLRRTTRKWADRPPRDGAFSRGDIAAIASVLGLALLFVSVAFAMSAATLYSSATWLKSTPIPLNGGDLRFLFPLVLDGLIIMFLALDLWTEWKHIRHPYYRWVAYGLSLLTLYLNVRHGGGGSLIGHAAPPLGVIVISEGLAIWIRSMAGLVETGRTPDRVPMGHWIARPASAFRVWRLMLGWNITSYEAAVEMERRRSMAYAMLREQYGDTWREATPEHVRWMLNNGHDLDVAYDITRALTEERVALSAEEVSGRRDTVRPAVVSGDVRHDADGATPDPGAGGDSDTTPVGDTGVAVAVASDTAVDAASDSDMGDATAPRPADVAAPGVVVSRGDVSPVVPETPVVSLSDMAERDRQVVEWLRQDPDMSGAEIGRRIGATAKTGQRLKSKLAPVARQAAEGNVPADATSDSDSDAADTAVV